MHTKEFLLWYECSIPESRNQFHCFQIERMTVHSNIKLNVCVHAHVNV